MFTRRDFLRASSVSALPAFTTLDDFPSQWSGTDDQSSVVRFVGDGPLYSPTEYLTKLEQINRIQPIKPDFYGKGGCIDELAKQFVTATGKEAAIYLASGTLANQLAISVLSGENTKVFVQQTSHVYRDEADAAQSVFGKRLIPLAPDKAYFTRSDLEESIKQLTQGEVFPSGFGAVSIENPVRRCDGQFVPLDEIKQIADFCRQKGYKLHLDGARLYLAAAYSGTSIQEYSSYFDTVYISLYKYLGAAGGAILCGSNEIINRMEHLAKIHGGVAFMSWANASMALHHLVGLEDRLKRSALQARQLFTQLNTLPEIKITPITNGTNIFNAQLAPAINQKKLSEHLWQKYQVAIANAKSDGSLKLMVNDSILNRTNDQIVKAFRDAILSAKA